MLKRIGRWLWAAALVAVVALSLPVAATELYAYRWDLAIGLGAALVVGAVLKWMNAPPRGFTLQRPRDEAGRPLIPPPAEERKPPPR